MYRPRHLVLTAIVLVAAAARLLPHPPNFAPIAAMALFGGAHFADRRLALGVPLAALLLSDALIGFHSGMVAVYGCFALITLLGLGLRTRPGAGPVAGAALTGSLLFFAVTNLAVWLDGRLYPRTAAGLVECYVAALPYFRNTLAGDAAFTVLLFGGFALVQRRWPALAEGAPA